MNKSPLTKILLGILAILSIWSLILCYRVISKSRDFRNLNAQATAMSVRLNAFNSLAVECLDYSKKNPAIDPILESVGIKSKGGAAATNTSASAPKTAGK